MQTLIDPQPNEFGSSFHGRLFRCMQSARYAEEDKKNQIGHSSSAQTRGSLIHIGLAHFLTRRSLKAGISVQHDQHTFKSVDELLPPDKAIDFAALQRGDYTHVEVAKNAITGFEAEYFDDPLEVVAAEHSLTMQIDDDIPWNYTLRVDWIARDRRNGTFWIIDTKTSSRMTSATLDAFSLETQFLAAHLLGQLYFGERFSGVMVQVVNLGKKVTFERTRPDFAPEALRQLPAQIRRVRREYRDLAAQGTPLDEYPKAYHNLVCRHSYGMCEFFERCQFGSKKV